MLAKIRFEYRFQRYRARANKPNTHNVPIATATVHQASKFDSHPTCPQDTTDQPRVIVAVPIPCRQGSEWIREPFRHFVRVVRDRSSDPGLDTCRPIGRMRPDATGRAPELAHRGIVLVAVHQHPQKGRAGSCGHMRQKPDPRPGKATQRHRRPRFRPFA